jgi:hypothetical protein
MNGSYDPYPDFSPLYEPTSFSWWLFSLMQIVSGLETNRAYTLILHTKYMLLLAGAGQVKLSLWIIFEQLCLS